LEHVAATWVPCAVAGSALAQGKSYYQVLKENPNHKFMIEMVDSVALYKNMLQNPPPGTPAMTIFAPVDAVSTAALPTADAAETNTALAIRGHMCVCMGLA
jgi:hypothetical protein